MVKVAFVFKDINLEINPLCQTFNNSSFSNTWFANKDWIIFCSSTQNLNNSSNFFIPSNNRI